MKQTAVEFLIEQFKIYLPSIHQKGLQDAFEQAIEMEKQQIMQAFAEGEGYDDVEANTHAQKYYSETYNKPTQ